MKKVLFITAIACMAFSSCNNQVPTAEPQKNDSTVAEKVEATTSEKTEATTSVEVKENEKTRPIFAIVNKKTTKLLIEAEIDNSENTIKNPEKYVYTIYNGQLHKIKYAGIQKGNKEENNGRDTPYNFENLPGYLYDVEGKALNKEEIWEAVLLVDDSFEKDSKVLKSTKLDKLPADLKTKLEKQYGRKIINVASCQKLGDNGENTFFAVQFENKGKNALGVAGLLLADGKMAVHDDAAEYNEISTWHADDEGEYHFNYNEAFIIDGKINLITSDYGGESIHLNVLEIEGDSLKAGKISTSLYQAPL